MTKAQMKQTLEDMIYSQLCGMDRADAGCLELRYTQARLLDRVMYRLKMVTPEERAKHDDDLWEAYSRNEKRLANEEDAKNREMLEIV